MADLKTKPNNASVGAFLKAVDDETKLKDCHRIIEIMQQITGHPPKMWGSGIIGFGSYHYVYESGREGDWPLTGFSPGKQNISLYIMSGFGDYEKQLANLGKHKTGKACLYVKKLEDINTSILKEMIEESVQKISKKYSVNK